MPAKIEMSLDEYQAIERARDAAEHEVVALKQQLLDAKLNTVVEGSDTNLRKIVALARSMLDVVRYAVGQLPPETNRGWPLKALRTIADLLQTLPDTTVDDASIAIEFRQFIADAERVELVRQEQDEMRRNAPEIA